MRKYNIQESTTRFLGDWMTARSFRVRLLTPIGQHFSKPYHQNKGVPQGGVLSPLMWILLINQIPTKIMEQMKKITGNAEREKDILVQIFADDISGVLATNTEEQAIEYAHVLVRILVRTLKELGLNLTHPNATIS